MATTLRASGRVLRIERRTGELDNGKPWETRTARLLLGNAEFADVKLPRDFTPQIGDDVDWTVLVAVSPSGALQVRAIGDFAAAA